MSAATTHALRCPVRQFMQRPWCATLALLLLCASTHADVHAQTLSTGGERTSHDAASAVDFSCAANLEPGRAEPRTIEATLGVTPALLRIPTRISMPPILLWHGFGRPASERALLEALPLDDVAAIKVYLGLPLFGKRAPSGGMDEIARRQSVDYGALLFEPAVIGAGRELAAVLDELKRRGCMHEDEPIGLLGFSAGGAAVLFALAERVVPVRAAVTLNAPIGLASSIEALERATKRAYSWSAHTRELAVQSDAIRRAPEIAAGDPPTALLLWHGAADRVIATRESTRLHQALLPIYAAAGHPERLKLLLAPEGAHDITNPALASELRLAVAAWFNAHPR
jgi:dienelactone hydrolase